MPLRTGAEHTRSVERVVAAPPGRVHAVVSDPPTTAAFSYEVQTAAWDPPLPDRPPRPGDVLAASMERGDLRWETRSTVLENEPGRRFVLAVGDPEHPTAVWTYDLLPEGDGTRLTYTVVLGDGPSQLSRLPEEQRPAAEQARLDSLARAMARTLDGVAGLVEPPR